MLEKYADKEKESSRLSYLADLPVIGSEEELSCSN